MIPRSAGLASGLTMGFSWGIGGGLGTLALVGVAGWFKPDLGIRAANLLALGLAAGVLVVAGALAAFLPREVGHDGSSRGAEGARG